jgi:MerR family transcriptional regulator, light-induced transcriptional regulator
MTTMETRSVQFNPKSSSDVPLYNIQAVAAATGVPSITLRSWERRYGVPEPKRDPKGYRLYSDRDIAVTRWLRERVQDGVGISRAVNLLRVLEHGDLVVPDDTTLDFASLQTKLLNAVEAMDESGVARVIAEGLTVATVEEVALHLLQPTLYEIGERWAAGQLSVTTEHVGSNLIRSHISQLARISPSPIRDERVMVACAPGEFHDIGALLLGLFLRRRGFDVIYGGANIEAEDFIADVLRLKPDAVCLSASTPQTAQSLRDLYAGMDGQYSGVLGYGGRAFNEHERLRDAVSGVHLGVDAGAATEHLETAFRHRLAG